MEQNKALVRRWIAEIDKRNLDVADELVAADYIDHNPGLPGTAPGREGLKQTNALLHAAFPDARHTIEDQIAEGDKVVTRMTVTGTFKGECMGIPPNGKQITMTGIMIHRIAGGQIIEHWAVADRLTFLQQMGAIPPLP